MRLERLEPCKGKLSHWLLRGRGRVKRPRLTGAAINMKPRFALSLVSTLALAPLFTGCLCTSPIMEQVNETSVDTFNPSAVYRRANPKHFALEGTRRDKRATSHAFLIIREDILAAAQLQTNENLSIEDIRKMYSRAFIISERQRANCLRITKELPS